MPVFNNQIGYEFISAQVDDSVDPSEIENIVFLHSSMSSKRQWASMLELLKSNHSNLNLLAIDLIGYGESTIPETLTKPSIESSSDRQEDEDIKNVQENKNDQEFTLKTEVNFIKPIIFECIGDNDFHLVGHSYGGAVATRFALDNFKKATTTLKSLTLFEPVLFGLLEKETAGWSDVAGVLKELEVTMQVKDFQQSARKFIDYWNGQGAFNAMPEIAQAQFETEIEKVMYDFDALTDTFITPNMIDDIKMPVLLMQGKDSRVSTHSIIKVLAKHFPNNQVVETLGGHMAPVSHRKDVNEKIYEFFQSQFLTPAIK